MSLATQQRQREHLNVESTATALQDEEARLNALAEVTLFDYSAECAHD